MNLCDLLWSLLKLYFRLQRKTQTPNGIQRHNGSANLPLTHTWIAFPALWRGLISHSKPPQCRPFLDLIKMQPLLITEATLHSEVCVHRNRQNLLRDKIFSSGSVPVSDCSSSNTGHSLSRVCVKGKREARWQDLILKYPPPSFTTQNCLHPPTLASLLPLLSYGWSSNKKKISRGDVSHESLWPKMQDYGSFEETQ